LHYKQKDDNKSLKKQIKDEEKSLKKKIKEEQNINE
jgi:hypothetical protein